MLRTLFASSLVPSLVLLAACGSDPASPVPESCDPPAKAEAFEIGTGELCFERLGATLPQMNGPQGGYHLFLALGCTDCGGAVDVSAEVLDAATMTAVYSPTEQIVTLSDGDWPQVAGLQISMPGLSWDDMDPPVAEGTAIVLHVVVKSEDGAKVLHDEQKPVTLGPITAWDPCDADPSGPCCDGGCN